MPDGEQYGAASQVWVRMPGGLIGPPYCVLPVLLGHRPQVPRWASSYRSCQSRAPDGDGCSSVMAVTAAGYRPSSWEWAAASGEAGLASSDSDPATSVCGFSLSYIGFRLPRDIGDSDSIPGSGRSPGGGHGNPLQCSCLENPMDRGAWRATVHGVSKSQT